VERSIGPGAKVTLVRRLGGGVSSAVHAVGVRKPSGVVLRLVLRRHLLFKFLQEAPDVVEKEARNLQLVEQAGIAAPRLVAVDPNGAECDVPAVLMTRMPGHLELKPRDIDPWLRHMAELLPPIHAIDPGSTKVQPWQTWDDLRSATPPSWSRRKREWERLIEIARGRRPKYRPTFVHRDFQHYNVLWSRNQPSAVLDWVSASIGPVELDFGHFRYNLLRDFGFDAAERFLKIYREVTGEEPNPFWEALNFGDQWIRDVHNPRDVDAYVASLVARLA
jgi:aminoglycoside phosphotransferase (APT) family kinase protein